MKRGITIYASKSSFDFNNSIEFYIVDHRDDGDYIATLEWGKVEPGVNQLPTLRLDNHMKNDSPAQRLMDQLYAAGIRPTDASGSAGSMAATQSHLEDMRTIAMHKLNIPMGKQNA